MQYVRVELRLRLGVEGLQKRRKAEQSGAEQSRAAKSSRGGTAEWRVSEYYSCDNFDFGAHIHGSEYHGHKPANQPAMSPDRNPPRARPGDPGAHARRAAAASTERVQWGNDTMQHQHTNLLINFPKNVSILARSRITGSLGVY